MLKIAFCVVNDSMILGKAKEGTSLSVMELDGFIS